MIPTADRFKGAPRAALAVGFTRIHLFLAATAVALALAGCAGTATHTTATSTPASTHTHRREVAQRRAVAHRRDRRASARRQVRARRRAARAAGQLTLITEPADGVAPILSAIAGARRQIDMVMYEDSDSQVNDALAAAEHRGVSVRVLLNGGYYGHGGSP